MTPTTDAPVTVEQCDRHAVQAFRRKMLDRLMSDVKSQRPKLGDDEGDAGTLVQAFARHRLAALASAPAGDHPDDVAVDRFAAAMKAKLANARDNGRGGWDDPAQCTVDHLRDLMRSHVAKGDPVDVANFCMMLFHRGGSTSAPAGDGYGKWHPMLLDIVNAIHGDRGEKTQAIGIDLSYKQALAAALARPRAAVGEREYPREQIARLCLSALFGFEYVGQDSLCDEADRIFREPNPRAVRAVALADKIATILALQSPPAKVGDVLPESTNGGSA